MSEKKAATVPGGLVAALIEARREFGPALKLAVNPHFKSRYVDLQGALEACEGPLAKNGLTLIQRTTFRDGITFLVTELAHVSGESREGEYPLIPSKDRDPQALGAALTYARRYTVMAMVGLAPEDDDGNHASGRNDNGPKAPPVAKSAKPSGPPAANGAARAGATAGAVSGLYIILKEKLGLGAVDEQLGWISGMVGREITRGREVFADEIGSLTTAALNGEMPSQRGAA